MKHYISCIIACIALAIAGASCTNGGDIGPLYGIWMIDSYTIDGVPQNEDLEHYSISFQGDVTRFILTYGQNEWHANMGFWRRQGSELIIDFSSEKDDWFFFKPIGFATGINTLRIDSESSRKLMLSRTNEKGQILRYELRKNL